MKKAPRRVLFVVCVVMIVRIEEFLVLLLLHEKYLMI